MIVKNNDFKEFIEGLKIYTGFLIYGPDKGKVKEKATQVIEKLKLEHSLSIIKVSQEDLEKNNLIDLIYQKNIFSKKSIISIDLDFIYSLKLEEKFFSSISSNEANYILIEAGNLNKSDTLVKDFIKSKMLACIPCYHDTEHSIKETIKDYSKKFNLKIDNDSIIYLSNRLGSDKLLTFQEIKKLSIYGNGEHVAYNDVLHAVGDSSLINLNKICDHLFNSNKAPYFYEKIMEAGHNNIIVIRSLLKHFYFLLNVKERDEVNLPQSIHFSRHNLIKKQINLLSKDKIKKIIYNIHELEKKSKEQYNLANTLIKKFLLYYSLV